MVVITKNFYITLGLAFCVLVVGRFLFRDSEIDLFATLMLAVVGGLSLLHFLDDRQYRREHEEQKREEIRRRLRV